MNPHFLKLFPISVFALIICAMSNTVNANLAYEWTTDHMQVGVRSASVSRPLNNAYELTRPILAEHSSYVMFWVACPGRTKCSEL